MGTNYLSYKKKFNRILEENIPILDDDGKQLKILKKEKWVQCYTPKDSVRKEYPKYLFVSDRGNFVSVFGKEPRWLTPSETSNGRESYKLSVKGKTKTTIGYIVVAVCFGSKTFGKADEMMEKKGRSAFGKINAFDLQVNHIQSYDKSKKKMASRAFNNNPDNLIILTINIHQLFQKFPPIQATIKEELEFSKEVMTRLAKEEVHSPVVIISNGNDDGTIQELNMTSNEVAKTVFENMDNMLYARPLTDNKDCLHYWQEYLDETTAQATKFYQDSKSELFYAHIEPNDKKIEDFWIEYKVIRKKQD
jgi:hypothetical protein